MRKLGVVLMIIGAVGVVVGILAALGPVLRSVGIAFSFEASSVSGPVVGGLFLLAVGWFVRRRGAAVPN